MNNNVHYVAGHLLKPETRKGQGLSLEEHHVPPDLNMTAHLQRTLTATNMEWDETQTAKVAYNTFYN